MYLEQLITLNYRSCKAVSIKLSRNNPNVLIGLNDSGKSTLLKSICLLLDEKAASQFAIPKDTSSKSDISNTPLSNDEIATILKEHSLPDIQLGKSNAAVIGKLILEGGDIEKIKELSEIIQWAHRDNSHLWLCRVFDTSANTNSLFIMCNDTSDMIELWNKKQTDLDKKLKELKIDPSQIKNDNGTGPLKNIEKLRAIYAALPTQPRWATYKADKYFLIETRYLDWNCSFEDFLTISNDALKEDLKHHLSEARKIAESERQKAEAKANLALEKFLNEAAENMPGIKTIKARLFFEVQSKLTDFFVTKNNADGEIHLDSQGDGIKRLIWYALLRYAASKKSATPLEKQFIWCFDEPECHLYPQAQRDFFESLKQTATGPAQVIISTHSTIFIDKSNLPDIRKTHQNALGYTELSECKQTEDILASLGIRNSDFLFYDRFIIVEGETEQELIPAVWQLLHQKTPQQSNTQIINLGGKDNRATNLRLLKQIMQDYRKEDASIIYIFDSDAQYDPHLPKIANCYFIGIQDGEDALPSDLWVRFINQCAKKQSLEGKITITVDEVEKIKLGLPKKSEAQSHEKFYPQLKKLISKKVREQTNGEVFNIIPEKGKSLGEAISELIQKDNIPEALKRALMKDERAMPSL